MRTVEIGQHVPVSIVTDDDCSSIERRRQSAKTGTSCAGTSNVFRVRPRNLRPGPKEQFRFHEKRHVPTFSECFFFSSNNSPYTMQHIHRDRDKCNTGLVIVTWIFFFFAFDFQLFCSYIKSGYRYNTCTSAYLSVMSTHPGAGLAAVRVVALLRIPGFNSGARDNGA